MDHPASGGRHLVTAALTGVMTVFAAGLALMSRQAVRGPGESLFPGHVAVVGYAIGVVLVTAGTAWWFRSLDALSASGASVASGVPWRVRRAVLRLGPVPAGYRDRVSALLDGRLRVARTLVPMSVWQFGLSLAFSAVQASTWGALAFGACVVAAGYLLLAACLAVYVWRLARARRHFVDRATA